MTDQLLETLRHADPLARSSLPDPPAHTLQAILATDREVVTSGRGRARMPRVALALAAAGATAAVAVAVLAGGSPDQPFGPSTASAALHQLALAATAHKSSDPPLKPGQFYYRRVVGYGSVHESWTSRDGVVYFRRSPLGSGPLIPPGTNALERSDSGGAYATFGSLEPLTYDEMLDLPRDTDKLYDWVRTHVQLSIPGDPRPPENKTMFFEIREFLITTPVPADLRAAFYDVAAQIPGVELLGAVRNEQGKSGLGIGMWRSGGPDDDSPPETADGVEIHQREDLIFDQQTGEIIGDRTVVNGKASGEALVEAGIVSDAGERP